MTNEIHQKGKFIVLEGLDGAGTTTQSHRLVDYLKSIGHKAHFTCEPSGGIAGCIIRNALKRRYSTNDPHFIAALFLADRIEHTKYEIIPLLEKGVDVVSDRYYHSSAYQVAGGVNLDYLLAIHQGIMAPDLTLFLDLSAKVGIERIEKNRATDPELFETMIMQERTQQMYYLVNQRLIERGEKIVSIDGTMSLEEVTKAIQKEVGKLY